jgi:predicted methyltransferase
MTSRSSFCLAGLFCLLLYVLDCAADATADIPAAVAAAVADPRRPAEQTKLDGARKPAASIAFARLKPGDRVVDFMPGNGYFTRILSDVVGPAGRVYAFIPAEQIANCPAREIAGTQAIADDPGYANVTVLTGALTDFHIPQRLDLIWMAQNYHDLHDSFLGPANVAKLNRAFFNALKPGGFFLGIDPARIRSEIEAAGFVFESQSQTLRNAADDHRLTVFDPLIRGRTDQIVFLFRRPQ